MIKLTKFSFFIFLISIPFGTRKFIYGFTPTFNEYGSIFLYASDILLVLFLILSYFTIFRKKSELLLFAVEKLSEAKRAWSLIRPVGGEGPRAESAGRLWLLEPKNDRFSQAERRSDLKKLGGEKKLWLLFLILFLIISAFSIFLASYQILAFYNFLRLGLLVLMALAVAHLLRRGILKFKSIMIVIAASAVFQSLVALFQFKFQSSIGLKLLGESVIGPFTQGVAKVIVNGGSLLRAYGTFPHANILAAFLILGLLSLFYLFLKPSKQMNRTKKLGHYLLIAIAIYLVLLGLVLTFSRSGWIVAFLLTLLVVSYSLIHRQYRRSALNLSAILVASSLLLMIILGWAILPRINFSVAEPSVSYRLLYNQLGLDLISSHPFGIGIGNQVLYAVDQELYQDLGLIKLWQWQPIHNIYLLISSEIGVIGLIVFLFLIGVLIAKNLALSDLRSMTAMVILGSLLLFGLVDHFPWDLQGGRLMLWLSLGIIMGIKRP